MSSDCNVNKVRHLWLLHKQGLLRPSSSTRFFWRKPDYPLVITLQVPCEIHLKLVSKRIKLSGFSKFKKKGPTFHFIGGNNESEYICPRPEEIFINEPCRLNNSPLSMSIRESQAVKYQSVSNLLSHFNPLYSSSEDLQSNQNRHELVRL